MSTQTLYYATNRNHLGRNRWKPQGYGTKFSDDGIENLRFGKVAVPVDDGQVTRFTSKTLEANAGVGDGEGLSGYLAGRVRNASKIQAFEEVIDPDRSDVHQKDIKLGSQAMFAELKSLMMQATDVVIYIHGFNVTWSDAVASALALQSMLNTRDDGVILQKVVVVLFTWPSDGMALPFVSYKSDRTEAEGTGYAFGRGLLKMRDYLSKLRDRSRDGVELCGQDLHLVCHSMGNYVLQNTLSRLEQFTPGSALPRMFENIFLCAPDVDDDVLEPGKPMGSLHELTRNVTVYHNRGDKAMYVSDYTKGNPERLGTNGAARPMVVHNKVEQVDCTAVVHDGWIEHSYYLSGKTNQDMRFSVAGVPRDGVQRQRTPVADHANVWVLR